MINVDHFLLPKPICPAYCLPFHRRVPHNIK
uniref:Uncharacterized protein n=1 Tax=Rhizophora mucronata TaxID=61149 RepID=A0A2P2Q125_RHIMU